LSKIKNKFKVKYVEQKKECDCAIACLAMILEFDYDFILGQFNIDFNKNGLDTKLAAKYLVDNGLSCIVKENYSHEQAFTANNEMLKPFADVHFVSFKQFCGAKDNHAVVMDSSGRIYDPGNPKIKKLDVNYLYSVELVLGLFYPSKFRTLIKANKKCNQNHN